MSWECQRCGLDDPYNGGGDGIGSCECPRCDCCAAGPLECDCERDWEPGWDDEDDVYDALCNDTACPNRQRRLAAADPTRAALNDYVRAEERRADEVTPLADEASHRCAYHECGEMVGPSRVYCEGHR